MAISDLSVYRSLFNAARGIHLAYMLQGKSNNVEQNVVRSAATVRQMFDSIAPRYDLLNTVLSGGIHKRWRRDALQFIPEGVERALDVCCGTGDLLPLIATRAKLVMGVDFSSEMLKISRARHPNFFVIEGDALKLPFRDASFDLVTVAFGVRNFEDLESGLHEIRRVLTVQGRLIVLEFGQPSSAIFGKLYNCYSNYILPHIGAFLSGNREAYRYLPKTAKNFPCGKEFTEILERAGFVAQHFKAHTFGIAYSYLAMRS